MSIMPSNSPIWKTFLCNVFASNFHSSRVSRLYTFNLLQGTSWWGGREKSATSP